MAGFFAFCRASALLEITVAPPTQHKAVVPERNARCLVGQLKKGAATVWVSVLQLDVLPCAALIVLSGVESFEPALYFGARICQDSDFREVPHSTCG